MSLFYLHAGDTNHWGLHTLFVHNSQRLVNNKKILGEDEENTGFYFTW